MIIDITHHKRAGKGLKKPYLAFLRPDGRGGVRREFVKPVKRGLNQKAFVAELRSGDVIEFRHTYWGNRSGTQGPVRLGDNVGYVITVEGGARWLALIGNRRMALNGDQAMQLASRPLLAADLEIADRVASTMPERIWPEPIWPGVHFS